MKAQRNIAVSILIAVFLVWIVDRTVNDESDLTGTTSGQRLPASGTDSDTGNNNIYSSRRNAITRAVELVSPAVVGISVRSIQQINLDPFLQFFYERQEPREVRGIGSGLIISEDGYIVTSDHVVRNALEIKVTMTNGNTYDAQLVESRFTADIALLKIEGANFPKVKFGNSDDIIIGEWAIALGNPFGLFNNTDKPTVSVGVISAVNLDLEEHDQRRYQDMIQTDASINPGNSGGPLLNIKGELIGINTAIFQKGEGIGFAIPINKAKLIVDDLISYGEVHQGWLGVFVQQLTSELAEFFGISDLKGVLISKVFKGGPAERAGLLSGDIIQAIDGQNMTSPVDFQDIISSYTAGDRLTINFIRNKKKKKVKLITTSIPENLAEELAKSWLGMQVDEITDDLISKYNLFSSNGVVITRLNPGSTAAKIGIFAGDVIRQINKQTIKGISDFRKAIIEAMKRKSVLFLVQRGRYGYYVTIEP